MNSLAPFVASHLDELRDICRRREVRRLWLFGSAVTDAFDPARSDVDALVEFAPVTVADPVERHFYLRQDLEELFGRKVDLVVAKAMRNPYFIREVESTRILIYDAQVDALVPSGHSDESHDPNATRSTPRHLPTPRSAPTVALRLRRHG